MKKSYITLSLLVSLCGIQQSFAMESNDPRRITSVYDENTATKSVKIATSHLWSDAQVWVDVLTSDGSLSPWSLGMRITKTLFDAGCATKDTVDYKKNRSAYLKQKDKAIKSYDAYMALRAIERQKEIVRLEIRTATANKLGAFSCL